MALIDDVRDRLTSQYNADIEALKHSAETIAIHERAAKFSGMLPIVSVCHANVAVYLCPTLRDDNKSNDYVKKYNGAYNGMKAGRPAFLCDVNGDSVFILGE